MGVIHKIGRRKTAVARVYVSEGTGVITVNKKRILQLPNGYFTVQSNATNVYDRNATNFDVKVNVYGGGSTGQAEAVRMALARVMCEVNPENRLILKPEGLTRDPRMVERKKFGQKKARKKFQFSTLIIACLEYIQDY
jgi:small subunit ribosomal protein S9